MRCVCVCMCGDPECMGVCNDSRGLPSLLLLTRDVPVFSHSETDGLPLSVPAAS